MAKHLVVQERDVVAAALELYRAGTGSDFADCMILEVARTAGHTPLATFDRKLPKRRGLSGCDELFRTNPRVGCSPGGRNRWPWPANLNKK